MRMNFTCLQTGLNQVASDIAAIEGDALAGMVFFSVLVAVPLAPVVLVMCQRGV
jgi:hypothetical protein